MRLTNVTQMTLPEGRLSSYGVRVSGAAVRRLPISFDQRRHVGEGERDGSWMAVAFEPDGSPTREDLATAWDRVVARHGTLRTVFSRDADGDLILEERAIEPGDWVEHLADGASAPRDALRRALDDRCHPFGAPSHRLCVLRPADRRRRPTIVIAADHSHVDMWSLLILVRDLLTELRIEPDVEVDHSAAPAPPASFAEHTAHLAQLPSAPEEIHGRWEDILRAGDGAMPTFPLPLGDVSRPREEVVEVRDVLDADEAAAFEAAASEAGVRASALGISVLTDVTATLCDAPLRAVFPVHSRHEPRWLDSVGWYITNSVIECADADPRAAAAAIREALALGSHPLQPILAPYGGMPARPGMFAISWLDTRRLPAVPPGLRIQYVSARVRTDGVMIWFIVNESGLHLRCRYPDTAQARTSVGRWLDAVQAGLRERVAPSRHPSH